MRNFCFYKICEKRKYKKMSGYTNNSCEAPIKHWKDYSRDELRLYMCRNVNKTDCSFVFQDPENVKPNKILESFKWMLMDMSPVLTEILNDKKSEAENWNLIPISDPNFELVIKFGCTKDFSESFDSDLFDFYEIAIKYQIGDLKENVYRLIPNYGFGSINWINFFRVLHMEKDPNWSKKLRERINIAYNGSWNGIPHASAQDLELQLKSESNIKMILDFDCETFFEFFFLITTKRRLNSLLSFKVTEAYLIKHVFNGKPPNQAEELGNIEETIIANFLDDISFGDITREEFQNGPGKSNLLDEYTKRRIFNKLTRLTKVSFFFPENEIFLFEFVGNVKVLFNERI